jgi:hypothetical protein
MGRVHVWQYSDFGWAAPGSCRQPEQAGSTPSAALLPWLTLCRLLLFPKPLLCLLLLMGRWLLIRLLLLLLLLLLWLL